MMWYTNRYRRIIRKYSYKAFMPTNTNEVQWKTSITTYSCYHKVSQHTFCGSYCTGYRKLVMKQIITDHSFWKTLSSNQMLVLNLQIYVHAEWRQVLFGRHLEWFMFLSAHATCKIVWQQIVNCSQKGGRLQHVISWIPVWLDRNG